MKIIWERWTPRRFLLSQSHNGRCPEGSPQVLEPCPEQLTALPICHHQINIKSSDFKTWLFHSTCYWHMINVSLVESLCQLAVGTLECPWLLKDQILQQLRICLYSLDLTIKTPLYSQVLFEAQKCCWNKQFDFFLKVTYELHQM